MKTINEEQRKQISRRLGNLGFLYYDHLENETEADEETKKALTEGIRIIRDIKKIMPGWYMPLYAYEAINCLMDGVGNDRDENGNFTIPYGLVNAINAILEM